jgi:hypothetical protein
LKRNYTWGHGNSFNVQTSALWPQSVLQLVFVAFPLQKVPVPEPC